MPQDDPGAQIMTVDAKEVFKELSNAARYREHYFVEACCGKTRIYQDLLECATQTILSIEVFKECLIRLGKWDTEQSSEKEVDSMINSHKECKALYRDDLYEARGPYVVPIAIDGVWVYQPAVVTRDEKMAGKFVLGRSILDAACLRRTVDWHGRIILDDHSGASVLLKWTEGASTRALLDTGAGPNVMTEGIWQAIGGPSLRPYSNKLYTADKSTIRVMGRTPPVKTRLGDHPTMEVSYLVIPSKGKNHLILGREFMMQFHVIVDLIRREARIYMPDGTPELSVAALSEEGDELPLTLMEKTDDAPKKKESNLRVAEVMMMEQDGDDVETDDGMSCDSEEPCVHPIPLYPGAFEYSRPVKEESYQWTKVQLERELPDLAPLIDLLSEQELDILRGIIYNSLEAFAENKYYIGCTTILQHEIELLEGAKPHKEPLRRLNPEKQRQADEQVAALLKLGVIEPANSPWGSGIVMAKKKDPKEYRMCIDFRMLNAQTIGDAFPLPRIDDTITSLGSARFFT